MKTTLALLVAAFGFTFAASAEASYFQDYCSNAAGTLTQAGGHDQTYFYATQRTWNPETGSQFEKVALRDVDLVETDSKTLESERHSSCREGDDYGVGSWRSVSYAKVRVTKTDGSEFPEGLVGLTADRKAIETSWICEHNGNSLMPCE